MKCPSTILVYPRVAQVYGFQVYCGGWAVLLDNTTHMHMQLMEDTMSAAPVNHHARYAGPLLCSS